MGKRFNVTGVCRPQMHYMVKLDSRLKEIRALMDAGEYFSINRARQCGKTTTLCALAEYVRDSYLVLSMDFQMFSYEDFATEASFVSAFAREILTYTNPDRSDRVEICGQP